jgi:mannan endo-1,4-beta-mannosidase
MHITHPANTNESGWFHWEETQIIQRAQKAYDQGMVNVFCWHFDDHSLEKSFNVRDRPEDIHHNCFRSILPGGERHAWYQKKLRKVAEVVGKIKGADGTLSPVIFRPFHEFDGSWFWWGKPYCTPDEYKQVWRFTVTYLRDELNVRNLLYAFSPDCGFSTEEEFLERYPGDAFVDLVGFDDYWDFEQGNIEAAATKLGVISAIAKKHKKIAALTEVGYRNDPIPEKLYTGYYGKAFADPSLEIAFLMFWRQGKEGESPYFTRPPHAPTAADFNAFLQSPRMILLPDTKSLYKWQ